MFQVVELFGKYQGPMKKKLKFLGASDVVFLFHIFLYITLLRRSVAYIIFVHIPLDISQLVGL